MTLSINARNIQNFPYNIQADIIKVQLTIFKDYNNSYLEGIEVLVYANFDTEDELIGIYNTDEFGVIAFTYNTDSIYDKSINTGQIWCKFSYNGTDYISNRTRINFIYDDSIVIDIIILNANNVATRISAPNSYVNVDANTTSTRLSTPDDYTIYIREIS